MPLDVIVAYHGGPLDGVTMCSDSSDPLEQKKVWLMTQIIGGCLRDAEKREVELSPGLIYTVPSTEIMERARKEVWNEAKVAALMPNYEYEFWKVRENDGIAEISLRFKGHA